MTNHVARLNRLDLTKINPTLNLIHRIFFFLLVFFLLLGNKTVAFGMDDGIFVCPEGKKVVNMTFNENIEFRCVVENAPDIIVQHGPYEIRTKTGVVIVKGVMYYGKPDGVWETFSEDGRITSKKKFNKGVLVHDKGSMGSDSIDMQIDGVTH